MSELSPGGRVALSATQVRVRVSGAVDLTALVLGEEGKVASDADMVFFNQPSASGVMLDGRELGLDLERLRPGAARIAISVSPEAEGASFGQIGPVSVEVESGGESFVFAPAGLDRESVLVLVEIYSRNGSWKLQAIGAGYSSGLAGLAREYGVEVDQEPAGGVAQTAGAVVEPVPAPEPVAAAPGIELVKKPLGTVSLTKAGKASISLSKEDRGTLVLRADLIWKGRDKASMAAEAATLSTGPSSSVPVVFAPASKSRWGRVKKGKPQGWQTTLRVVSARGGSGLGLRAELPDGTSFSVPVADLATEWHLGGWHSSQIQWFLTQGGQEWKGRKHERIQRQWAGDENWSGERLRFCASDGSAGSGEEFEDLVIEVRDWTSPQEAKDLAESMFDEADGDLDLYALVMTPAGVEEAVYYRNLGSVSEAPWVALSGDSLTPGIETLRIVAGKNPHVLICAYSAVGNGVGSFRSYNAHVRVDDGCGSVIEVPLYEENPTSYWVAIAHLDMSDPDNVVVSQVERYGRSGSERRPVLAADGSFEMSRGKVEFKDFDVDELGIDMGDYDLDDEDDEELA